MPTQLRKHQISVIPLRISMKKLIRKVLSRLVKPIVQYNLYHKPTYTVLRGKQTLRTFLQQPIPCADEHDSILLYIIEQYSNGKYSFLGSGWTSMYYGSDVKGFDGFHYPSSPLHQTDSSSSFLQHDINSANHKYSTYVRSLLPQDTIPLNWQRDCRSGYEWDSKTISTELTVSPGNGADPKLPWEFGRMHFLLHYALRYAKETSQPERDALWGSIRTILLDFIAQNPPSFGIQWSSSMDVAIRSANMVVALDILQSSGCTFDEDFTSIIVSSLQDHCMYVFKHREWSDGMRGNHYLANIAGLLITCAYIPNCPSHNTWIEYCCSELKNEILYQFNPDGSNFEASIPYHRLSFEMIIWSIAYIDALGYSERFLNDKLIVERLTAIATFSKATIALNGNVPCIGDDDSGRFLPLIPFLDNQTLNGYHPQYHVQNQSHLLRSIHPLTNFLQSKKSGQLLKELLKSVTGSYHPPSRPVLQTWNVQSFPDFGVDYYSNNGINVSLRAGTIGQMGKGGHAHADQLSITMQLDGEHLLIDAGTYSYTSAPDKRNYYRSTSVHNTLQRESYEQYQMPYGTSESLFWILGDYAKSKVISRLPTEWHAEHHGFGTPHTRSVYFSESTLDIIDNCRHDGMNTVRFLLHPACALEKISDTSVMVQHHNSQVEFHFSHDVEIMDTTYSPSYGTELLTNVLIVQFPGHESCTTKIFVKK